LAYKLTPYKLEGLLLVEAKSYPDERGFFMESFRERDAEGTPIPRLVQDNLSRSKKGVLRGLHYQISPNAIGKLIRCVRGRIWDVAVDIRKGSPTYGQWAALDLDDSGNRMFWIPPGFAHGFYTLSDEADVLYKVSGYWSLDVDRGVRWDDPALKIDWPGKSPLVSPKDAVLPTLAEADNNLSWP
jgi:dTDP-4-dehydrorhamnose 3,5-epimerase